MRVFHEVEPDSVDIVMERGLVIGASGEKTDRYISMTDTFLNSYRPDALIQKNINRETNLYCYLGTGNAIIDISSGKHIPVQTFANSRPQALLQIEVETDKCYVSDLDLFDQVMEFLKNSDEENAEQVAYTYWSSLQLLQDYDGAIHRPEVIIPYNVPSSDMLRIA